MMRSENLSRRQLLQTASLPLAAGLGRGEAPRHVSGSYRVIRRTWASGHRAQVSLPMSLHAQPMPDDRTLQVFLYGPVVRGAGAAGGVERFAQVIPVPRESLTFRLAGQTKNLRLIPLSRVFEERYAVYWRVRA